MTDTEEEIPIRLLRDGHVEQRERSESEQTFDALITSSEVVNDAANALSVRAREGDVVILSGGLNRDVILGQEYFVYRGKQYCGRIEITEVLQDLSAARILDRRSGKTHRHRR